MRRNGIRDERPRVHHSLNSPYSLYVIFNYICENDVPVGYGNSLSYSLIILISEGITISYITLLFLLLI